jgi:hypothetical protein
MTFTAWNAFLVQTDPHKPCLDCESKRTFQSYAGSINKVCSLLLNGLLAVPGGLNSGQRRGKKSRLRTYHHERFDSQVLPNQIRFANVSNSIQLEQYRTTTWDCSIVQRGSLDSLVISLFIFVMTSQSRPIDDYRWKVLWEWLFQHLTETSVVSYNTCGGKKM